MGNVSVASLVTVIESARKALALLDGEKGGGGATAKEELSKMRAGPGDEVVFIDGVGAVRSSVKACRDGVQWIKVGDRVYWPLSDSDAKRLHSACCGNGSFDGPSTR